MEDNLVFNRLFDKLDQIERRLSDLCIRLTTVETNHKGHIDELKRERTLKDKNVYKIIAIVGAILTVLQIYQILR